MLKKSALRYFKSLIYGILLFQTSSASAQDDDLAVYYKCYSQVTQKFPTLTNAGVQAVRTGADPVETCLSVLRKAILFPNNGSLMLQNQNDAEAIAVLNSFNDMHFSWFSNRTLQVFSNGDQGIRDIFEHTVPALYITRAVFGSNIAYNSVFKHNLNLDSVRVKPAPYNSTNSPFNNMPESDYIFDSLTTFKFADRGHMVGIRDIPANLQWPWTDGTRSGTARPGLHFGGGVLGSQVFLMATNQIGDPQYKTDAGVILPRRWPKYILKDLMCRDIPVVRYSDATTPPGNEVFVHPENQTNIPFRTSGSCVRCHASIDRMAYSIRSLRAAHHANFRPGNRGLKQIEMQAQTLGASDAVSHTWLKNIDTDFYRRANIGSTFYFRDYLGNLQNNRFTQVSELGNLIAGLADPYICLAKRYFEYFTGQIVWIGDQGDPSNSFDQSSAAVARRNFVIDLGLDLKANSQQNAIETVIKPILQSQYYRNASVGGQ